MMDKQLKVHPGQSKSEGSGARGGQESASLFLRTPDMETLLANQRHGLEAMMAATEKLLEGATEISRKQLALHNTLMRQAFRNTLDYMKSDGTRDGKAEEKLEAGTETTFEAMRDIASTALKCNLDALSAFSDRIRRMEAPRAVDRSHPAQAAD
ncbi:MAG: hypothetical protein JNL04_09535 [Rhodospirillaceae bacterium]|nr:hypothetical protein [Rhodospirillaceae bacterium]